MREWPGSCIERVFVLAQPLETDHNKAQAVYV